MVSLWISQASMVSVPRRESNLISYVNILTHSSTLGVATIPKVQMILNYYNRNSRTRDLEEI